MDDLGLSLEQIRILKKTEIENMITKWDSIKWRENMGEKRTMELYRNCKEKPEEVKWFRNDYKCSIMMQSRSNSLKLNWRALNENRDKSCQLCGANVETLEHFVIYCEKLQEDRSKPIKKAFG